jgi:hypothetical protein
LRKVRNHGSLMQNDDISNTDLLQSWYEYASGQFGFVGSLLRVLREQQKTTPKQQQIEFGATKEDFARLQGMPLPRPNQFTKDAQRIAEACDLKNISGFVNALLLARSIERAKISEGTNRQAASTASASNLNTFYQAAHDADEDLDDFPEEE